jgi:hypothetical protein
MNRIAIISELHLPPLFPNRGDSTCLNAGKQQTKNKKMIKKLIQAISAKTKVHASLTDIKGNKSGGTRDSNKNDWYTGVHN